MIAHHVNRASRLVLMPQLAMFARGPSCLPNRLLLAASHVERPAPSSGAAKPKDYVLASAIKCLMWPCTCPLYSSLPARTLPHSIRILLVEAASALGSYCVLSLGSEPPYETPSHGIGCTSFIWSSMSVRSSETVSSNDCSASSAVMIPPSGRSGLVNSYKV